MSESLNIKTQESIAPGLEPVKIPDSFFTIRLALMDPGVGHIDGFDDVLFGEALGKGAGGYFNTFGPPIQLVFALSIVPNPSVMNLIGEKAKSSSQREIVQGLREIRPLSGMKILDLGCGLPTFALAAGTLGAEMYTVDHGDKFHAIKAKLTGHTDIDLNDANALRVLQDVTGGEFDLVTENIN